MLNAIVEEVKTLHPLFEFWYFFKKNKGALFGLILVILFSVLALIAPWIAPYEPSQIFSDSLRLPPSFIEGGHPDFFLGTDDVGRDIFSRLLYGARVSMGIGILVVIFSTFFGSVLGLISGYFGGVIDKVIMRMVDILMAMPSILLAIVVVSILGPNLFNAIIAVSIVSIPSFTRLVRAGVLSEKKKQYVLAGQTFGASHFRQMFINIFPNCMAPLIVQATLGFSNGILDAAALGFLGLGAQPPTPEWGTMLADARQYIETSPWPVTLPGLCILTIVLAFNLFGDGLRDALDPRMKK